MLMMLRRKKSFSYLSAIRVISSAYMRLLIFLLAILIPLWGSSSPAFHMTYSAYKLNKQGDKEALYRIFKKPFTGYQKKPLTGF